MSSTRREFMRTAAIAGAAAATFPFSPVAGARTIGPVRYRAPKRVLVLGGTTFVGPAFVEAAKKRGYEITLFNRGRAEKRFGTVEGVETLYGNRDPKLRADDSQPDSPLGMESLKGREWDAVLDTSGWCRRIVAASAELLAPKVKQYIYISSISVYTDTSKPGADETAEVHKLADEDVETNGARFENYGGLKALCERTAEQFFPKRTAAIRPGLIVGPGDPTDRFTYWPVRMQKGGEVMAPGTPRDPLQIIDVRDLGEWIVHVIENNINGTFDAVGPPTGLTMGDLIDSCKQATNSDAKVTWVDASFLEEQQVSGWGDMPVWVPPSGESAGFHQRTIARATAAGLKFRPVLETTKDTLAWWPKEVERRKRVTKEMIEQAEKEGKPKPTMADPSVIRYGIKPEREAQVLAAWHKKLG